MIEYDGDGKEWFGYTLSSEGKDPERVISIFSGNIQYVEYRYRQIVSKQRCSLATQLQVLFELLPNEAQRSLTDDRPSLIAEIVRIRNRYAHGKFEEATPSIARVHTLSVKVAVLLSFLEYPVDDPSEALWTKRASPFLQRQLDQTDVPADNHSTVRAQRKPAHQERLPKPHSAAKSDTDGSLRAVRM